MLTTEKIRGLVFTEARDLVRSGMEQSEYCTAEDIEREMATLAIVDEYEIAGTPVFVFSSAEEGEPFTAWLNADKDYKLVTADAYPSEDGVWYPVTGWAPFITEADKELMRSSL